MGEDEKKRGFEVRDSRVATETEGEGKEEEAKKQEPDSGSPPEKTGQAQESQSGSPEEQEKQEPQQPDSQMPEITFPAFLLSLNTSALIHLGLIQIPGTEKAERNLPLAKQTIDLLNLIKEKTRGNLTQEESDLLDNLLFDLKMKYVELGKEQ